MSDHFSADVKITLHLGGSALPCSHLAPDFFILRTPFNYPPAEAELSLAIDGNEQRWRVRLPQGCSSGAAHTPYDPLEST